jgi:hypothetical protein
MSSARRRKKWRGRAHCRISPAAVEAAPTAIYARGPRKQRREIASSLRSSQ